MENEVYRVMLLLAVVYLLVGVAFAEFARWSTTNTTVIMWRRLAWLVSGVAFAAHIGFEHFRQRNSPRKTAMHASVAARANGLKTWPGFTMWVGPRFIGSLPYDRANCQTAPSPACCCIVLVSWPNEN